MTANGSAVEPVSEYVGLAQTKWELRSAGVGISRGQDRFLVTWDSITNIEVKHLDIVSRGHIRLEVNGSRSKQPAPGDPYAIVTKGVPLRFGVVNAELDVFANLLRSRMTGIVQPLSVPPTPSAPATPLPGWYDDQVTRGVVRWWDGRSWTQRVEKLNRGGEYFPPAWHADPAAPGVERWWDGLAWSEGRRAAPVQTEPTAAPPHIGRHAVTATEVEKSVVPAEAFSSLRVPARATSSGPVPYRPPGNLWPSTDIVGESHYRPAIQKVLGRLRAHEEREMEVDATLVPEPTNRHDPKAIAVHIDNEVVGYLAREDAVAWGPSVRHVIDAGGMLTPKARVWGRNDPDDRDGLFCSVRLALPEPDLTIPLNTAPTGDFSIVPWGSRLKVMGDAANLTPLSRFLGRQQQGLLLATLATRTEVAARGAERVIVDVAVDGAAVGSLTPASSKNIAPLVEHLTGRGLEAAAWITLRGSTLAVDVGLQIAKATEVPEEWLHSPAVVMPSFGPTAQD